MLDFSLMKESRMIGELILLLAFLGMGTFGFCIMKKWDCFFSEIYHGLEKRFGERIWKRHKTQNKKTK